MLQLTEKQCEALRELEEHNGNLRKTAQALGIEISSLGNRIERIRRNAIIDPLVESERRMLLRKIEKQRAAAEREKMEPFRRCDRPCSFRAPDKSPWGCDYLSIMGVSRGCPPGEKCTKFEEGERKPLIMDEWSVPKVNDDADLYVRKRYRQHLQYIAEKSKK